MSFLDANFSNIAKEVIFEATRSRGPGGQNVNKVSSSAQLYFNYLESYYLSEYEKTLITQKAYNSINSENQIYLRSDEFRDLEKNKKRCLEKLKALLSMCFFKPKPRKATKPTYSSKVKRKESKKRHGETKKNRQKIKY